MSFNISDRRGRRGRKGTNFQGRGGPHFGWSHLEYRLLYRVVGARMLEGMDPVAAARESGPRDLERDDREPGWWPRRPPKVA